MTDYLNETFNIQESEFASTYDELPLWSAPFGLLLLEHIPLKSGMIVLDVGCGTGFPLIELAGRFGNSSRIYGIDPWKAALELLNRKIKARGLKNVKVIEGNAVTMPFETEFFDLIVSNLGLNNFEDRDKAIAECNRVLKKGGTLSLTTNLVGHMREFYEAFEKVLVESGVSQALPALKKHVEHRAEIESTVKLLDQAGFKTEKTIRDSFALRFADGSSFLRHPFIKMAFLGGWKDVMDEGNRLEVFALLEEKLNKISNVQGELKLTVPMAYIEVKKT